MIESLIPLFLNLDQNLMSVVDEYRDMDICHSLFYHLFGDRICHISVPSRAIHSCLSAGPQRQAG